MEYLCESLNKYFGNYSSRRGKQLDMEKQIDDLLPVKCKRCPGILVEYLLWRRDMNRVQFRDLDKCGIFDKKSVLENNLNEIDTHYESVLGMLENDDDACVYLETLFLNKN